MRSQPMRPHPPLSRLPTPLLEPHNPGECHFWSIDNLSFHTPQLSNLDTQPPNDSHLSSSDTSAASDLHRQATVFLESHTCFYFARLFHSSPLRPAIEGP